MNDEKDWPLGVSSADILDNSISSVTILGAGSGYQSNRVDPFEEKWNDASNKFGLNFDDFKEMFELAKGSEHEGLSDLLMQAVVYFKLQRNKDDEELSDGIIYVPRVFTVSTVNLPLTTTIVYDPENLDE
jgi:hypothetical protein